MTAIAVGSRGASRSVRVIRIIGSNAGGAIPFGSFFARLGAKNARDAAIQIVAKKSAVARVRKTKQNLKNLRLNIFLRAAAAPSPRSPNGQTHRQKNRRLIAQATRIKVEIARPPSSVQSSYASRAESQREVRKRSGLNRNAIRASASEPPSNAAVASAPTASLNRKSAALLRDRFLTRSSISGRLVIAKPLAFKRF